jgi:hypothetical protein
MIGNSKITRYFLFPTKAYQKKIAPHWTSSNPSGNVFWRVSVQKGIHISYFSGFGSPFFWNVLFMKCTLWIVYRSWLEIPEKDPKQTKTLGNVWEIQEWCQNDCSLYIWEVWKKSRSVRNVEKRFGKLVCICIEHERFCSDNSLLVVCFSQGWFGHF